MATTIKSTALDFVNIKNNLKSFLEQKPEFADYNFETSGLSNLLDVLAYNTHINALTANFALNESFLGTAQLRSSLVSLSEGIGYIPDSKTASEAIIRLSLNLSGIGDRSPILTVPAGLRFESTVNDVPYIFQTQETIIASDDGAGFYRFTSLDGSPNISIFEGVPKTKTFIAGDNDENTVYIIPDENMDIDTAVVRVFESASATAFTTYTNILKATTISEQSTLFILKETPNGLYELTFGNGTTLGQTPQAGFKITVDYLATNGAAADNALIFEPLDQILVGENIRRTATVSTVSRSAGGGEKESIESIRKNAPFQYAAQNRMVTYADYSSLVLRNFSSLIEDIKAWGGEDNLEPEFGTVFMSIKFNDDITEERRVITKDSVRDLAEQLAVASFDLKFTDPITTFIEVETFFQFNPRLTTLSLNTIQDQVRSTVETYFENSVGGFERSFRRSNMLSLIDDVSPAVLSSRANVRMQQRLTPGNLIGLEADYSFSYPVPIADPDDQLYRAISSSFIFRDLTCQIRNQLNSTKLQVIDLSNNRVVVDNVGTYNPNRGRVDLVGLQIDQLLGGLEYITISVTPANESAISPQREYILEHDSARSTARGVIVTASN